MAVSIWVTRPQPQAARLAAVLQQAGFRAEAVPTLEIAPPPDADTLTGQAPAQLQQAQVAIFVSRNAVDWLWRLLGDEAHTYLAHCQVFAVGPGTAAALQAQGLAEASRPDRGSDSEALLALPQLSEEAVTGQRVVIVRGRGGRALLAETLQQRGAEVGYLEVYQRRQASETVQRLPGLWQTAPPAAIVVSSPAGLEALLDMTAAADQPRLLATPLLCMGGHLQEQSRHLGFEECIPVTPAGGDEAIVSALRARLTRQEQ